MVQKAKPDFEAMVAEIIADGANELVAEYDDNEWWLSIVEGNNEFGVARYSTEQEKKLVDEGLSRLKKAKSISVNGKLYRLAFKYKDNFGEPLWRIRVSESK
jgi:hypothetical protein